MVSSTERLTTGLLLAGWAGLGVLVWLLLGYVLIRTTGSLPSVVGDIVATMSPPVLVAIGMIVHRRFLGSGGLAPLVSTGGVFAGGLGMLAFGPQMNLSSWALIAAPPSLALGTYLFVAALEGMREQIPREAIAVVPISCGLILPYLSFLASFRFHDSRVTLMTLMLLALDGAAALAWAFRLVISRRRRALSPQQS